MHLFPASSSVNCPVVEVECKSENPGHISGHSGFSQVSLLSA